jgi:hypothetical protein
VAPKPEPIIPDGHATQLGAIGVPIFLVFDGHSMGGVYVYKPIE